MFRSQSTGRSATPIAGVNPGLYKGTFFRGGVDYTGRLSGVVASNFLFELQAARHNEKSVQEPLDTVDRRFGTITPTGVPPIGGYGFFRQQTFQRNYFRGSMSYYANLLGTHELKGGGDYTQNASNSLALHRPPGNKEIVGTRNYSAPVRATVPGCKLYEHGYNSSGQRNAAGDPIEVDAPATLSHTTTGVFIQDKWRSCRPRR